jgi:hypothetical protein
MREDPLDELGLLEAGDHLESRAAAAAALDFEAALLAAVGGRFYTRSRRLSPAFSKSTKTRGIP